jgi:putative tryptophan/tyrosine transport system substrate-binding protein
MGIHRRTFVLGAGCLLLASPLQAQVPVKLRRIGHVSTIDAQANKPLLDAFRQGMKERGLVEGRHYVLDEVYADGKFDRLPSLIQALLARKPDVLLASTTPGNLAVKAAKTNVPVVFVLVADPVGAGIVPSLARQKVSVTGVTNLVAELGGKRLQILQEIFPKAARFAVLVNPDDQNTPLQMRFAQEGAKALGIKLDPILEVRNGAEMEAAFDKAEKAGVVAAIRMIDPLVWLLRKQTVDWAVSHKLPIMFALREDVEAGGLISYGAGAPEQFRQAASMIDKVLKGTPASDIPVEQPTTFDLAINMKTAKAIGITIPQSLLIRADKVIQ